MNQLPNAFIFMKVGNHAGETLEVILERKRQELARVGRIFWGYGGTSCHPLSQVQPFVRTHVQRQGSVYLVMQPINSRADPDVLPAREYSEDGVRWKPIPEGILVTGSRYAFVLDEIKPAELNMNASDYLVDVGPSRGKCAAEYLKGHVDKACLVRNPDQGERELAEPDRFTLAARLQEPYAVLLR